MVKAVVASEDKEISQKAINSLGGKSSRKKFAKEFITKIKPIIGGETWHAVFMAGAPGAGKTEYCRRIVPRLESSGLLSTFGIKNILVIDPDDIRENIPGYIGEKAYCFQQAMYRRVCDIFNRLMSPKYEKRHFILDGTMSNYQRSKENITNVINKGGRVHIVFIYQNPETAWKNTQAREAESKRNVPRDVFIQAFVDSIDTVNKLKAEFNNIDLTVAIRGVNLEDIDLHLQVQTIDSTIVKIYTTEQLDKLIQ